MKTFFGEIPLPFRNLTMLFVVTAVLGVFIGTQTRRQGQWLPQLPIQVDGIWDMTDMPLDASTLAQLGNPKTQGARYTNPYGEKVDAHVIAAASIDAYHEPSICMAGYGYTLTGQQYLPLFGPNKRVRVMVLRNDSSQARVLLYYWVQDQDGDTFTQSSFRAYQDYGPRMNLGINALSGGQRCIIRAYTEISSADPDGRQARRNLTEVAHNLYETLRKDDKHNGKASDGNDAS